MIDRGMPTIAELATLPRSQVRELAEELAQWTTFNVDGVPAPKGSINRGGGGQMYSQSERLPAWNDAIVERIRYDKRLNKLRIEVPFDLSVTFRLNTRSNPDADKLLRALCDGLQKARMISDDKLLARASIEKRQRWEGDSPPGAYVAIRETPVDWVRDCWGIRPPA